MGRRRLANPCLLIFGCKLLRIDALHLVQFFDVESGLRTCLGIGCLLRLRLCHCFLDGLLRSQNWILLLNGRALLRHRKIRGGGKECDCEVFFHGIVA